MNSPSNTCSKVPTIRTGPIRRTVLISDGSYCSFPLLHYENKLTKNIRPTDI